MNLTNKSKFASFSVFTNPSAQLQLPWLVAHEPFYIISALIKAAKRYAVQVSDTTIFSNEQLSVT